MCDVRNCRQKDLCLIYYGREVCEKHIDMDCNENDSFNLKKEFGIGD